MKESSPSKAEQVEALIHGTAYNLTMQYAGRDQSGRHQYSKVFTVTREEIEDYVKDHYRLDNLPFTHSSPSQIEGIFIIPISGGYRVYHQERGMHFDEKLVKSEDAAWCFYFDYALRLTGTGLKWD